MLFDSVYLAGPSDTVTKYAIYPPTLLPPRYLICRNILLLYPMTSKTWLKMPCILLFEMKYLLEFVSKNPPFSSCPSSTKIQAAFICR